MYIFMWLQVCINEEGYTSFENHDFDVVYIWIQKSRMTVIAILLGFMELSNKYIVSYKNPESRHDVEGRNKELLYDCKTFLHSVFL